MMNRRLFPGVLGVLLLGGAGLVAAAEPLTVSAAASLSVRARRPSR